MSRFPSLTGAGKVHLLLTAVAGGEILTHLYERPKEHFWQIKEFRRVVAPSEKIRPGEAMYAPDYLRRERQ